MQIVLISWIPFFFKSIKHKLKLTFCNLKQKGDFERIIIETFHGSYVNQHSGSCRKILIKNCTENILLRNYLSTAICIILNFWNFSILMICFQVFIIFRLRIKISCLMTYIRLNAWKISTFQLNNIKTQITPGKNK